MKRIDAESIEWRALSETMVLPMPAGGAFSRTSVRRTIGQWYPFDLGGCGITRLSAIGAILVTPPVLSQSAASRPVPALAISRSARVRRSLSAGETLYRFGTPRGYDFYHFRRRRLVACWSAVSGELSSTPRCAGPLQFPRGALTTTPVGGHSTREQRALLVTVLLAAAALAIQLVPERSISGERPASPAVHPTGMVSGGTSSVTDSSPFPVLHAAFRVIPDLRVHSFSRNRNRYRWHLTTENRRFDITALTKAYPDINISVAHRNTHTTISLEGTR